MVLKLSVIKFTSKCFYFSTNRLHHDMNAFVFPVYLVIKHLFSTYYMPGIFMSISQVLSFKSKNNPIA